MKFQEYIIEAKNKLSFVQYFFNKNNYKKLQKEYSEYQNELAMQYGEDLLGDDSYYSEEELEQMEISPDEAYDNYAHAMGYQAEWDAATELIRNHKNKYNYQRGDENERDNQYVPELIEYLGFSVDFGSYRSRKRKEDYWKMAEEN